MTGTDHNSISKKPILPLRNDLDHLILPRLHIELGLTVRYFNCLKRSVGSRTLVLLKRDTLSFLTSGKMPLCPWKSLGLNWTRQEKK